MSPNSLHIFMSKLVVFVGCCCHDRRYCQRCYCPVVVIVVAVVIVVVVVGSICVVARWCFVDTIVVVVAAVVVAVVVTLR